MSTRPPLSPFTHETAVRLAEDGWNSRDPEKIALAYTLNSLFGFCQKPQRSLKPTQQVHTEKPDNSPIADRADFYRCRRRFLLSRRQTENLGRDRMFHRRVSANGRCFLRHHVR